MNKLTKEQRSRVLKHLPEDVREVFFAPETTSLLVNTGDKHDLSSKERSELGEAVGLVLLGILKQKEFQEQLYERLDQKKESINEIVKTVQKNVFQPVSAQLEQLENPRDILKRLQEKDDIPVPQPPASSDDGVPTPSYGGTSDPYREPIN